MIERLVTQCCIAVAVFLIFLDLNPGYAADENDGCIKVSINSAKAFYLKKDDLATVAIGSGGSGAVFDYVTVSKPKETGGYDFSDVTQIILMADIWHHDQISCQVFPNYPDLSQCAVSMPVAKLKLIVKFDKTAAKTAPRYEERTMAMAKFIQSEIFACQTKN